MERGSTPALVLVAAVGLLIVTGFGFVALLGGLSAGSTAVSVCGQFAADGPSATGEPALTADYLGAAARFKLGDYGYAYLAAINEIETRFGTDMAVSSAGAVGWMQFEPATFAEYAVSVTDPSGPADPDDPADAIYTAARMLAANGAPVDWGTAIFAYDHADWYVQEVEQAAQRYIGATGLQNLQSDINLAWDQAPPATVPSAVLVSDTSATATTAQPATELQAQCAAATSESVTVSPVAGSVPVIMADGLARPPQDLPAAVKTPVTAMIEAGDRITPFDYQWGGGHADPELSDNQTDPQPQGGSEPGQNGTPGYDCSGSTDYLLWAGGFGPSLLGDADPASTTLATAGQPGAGEWVTWYANSDHVFIMVDGIVLDTVHGPTTVEAHDAPSTGPRWATGAQVSFELANDGVFAARHPEGL